MIAVANIWIFFYTPGYGLINQILQILGLPGQNWLGDPQLALGAVIVVAIWKEAGFFMIFCSPLRYRRSVQAIARPRRSRG